MQRMSSEKLHNLTPYTLLSPPPPLSLQVHKKSKDSTKHAYLHGKSHKIAEANAKKVREMRATRSSISAQQLAGRMGQGLSFF